MATPTRTPRQWFQDSIAGPLGKRFNTGNKPDKEAFKALFDSYLNPAEVEDTANTQNAGHVKISTDEYAINRVDSFGEYIEQEEIGGGGNTNQDTPLPAPHTIVVQPHHLPNMESSDGTEVTGQNLSVSKGGLTLTAILKQVGVKARRNFRIALNLGGSLKITGEKLVLDGDEEIPDDGKFYGKRGGVKGWFASTFPSWLWTPMLKKQLVSDGTNLFWDSMATGTSGGSIPPDGKSLILNQGKMALHPRSTTLGQLTKAAAVAYDEQGVYVRVDGDTLIANNEGVLVGLTPDEQSIERNAGRFLQAKLMYNAFPPNPGKAVGPPPPLDWHVYCAPVVHYTTLTEGLFVRIDPQTLGYNAYNQLYVKSGAVNGGQVMISDDFTDTVISGKWSNQGAVTDSGYGDVNGMIALPVSLSNGVANIVQRSKATIYLNPELETRLYVSLQSAMTTFSPVVCIGHIGYHNDEVKDFVGFTLDKSGYWAAVVMKNSVITNTIKTDVPINELMHTFNVRVFADGSVKFMIDNVDAGTFPAGTCYFTYELATGADIRNKVAEDNSIHIDYINISRDRNTAPNT